MRAVRLKAAPLICHCYVGPLLQALLDLDRLMEPIIRRHERKHLRKIIRRVDRHLFIRRIARDLYETCRD